MRKFVESPRANVVKLWQKKLTSKYHYKKQLLIKGVVAISDDKEYEQFSGFRGFEHFTEGRSLEWHGIAKPHHLRAFCDHQEQSKSTTPPSIVLFTNIFIFYFSAGDNF